MTNELAKAEVPVTNGMVQISTIEGAYRYADLVHKSRLAPACFETVEQILVAMQMGAELGLTPLASLSTIQVIKGKPSLGGKDMPSFVINSGQLEKFDESYEGSGDDMKAVCVIKRKGLDSVCRVTFSVGDAKRAGLWGTQTWAKYPKDMLKYKARARAFPTLFGDVLRGMPIAEDIQEVAAVAEKPKKKRRDPLLKNAEATVVEPEPETTTGAAKHAHETEDAPTDPVISSPSGSDGPAEVAEVTPPDTASEADAASADLLDDIPDNADLIAAVEAELEGIGELDAAGLRRRLEAVYGFLNCKENIKFWKAARAQVEYDQGKMCSTNKHVAALGEAGLRELLTACLKEVKA